MSKNKDKDGSSNISGVRIRELRKSKGLSQRGLADNIQDADVDLGKNAIQKIESGERSVNDIELKAFAKFFGVTVDSLLGIEDGAEYK